MPSLMAINQKCLQSKHDSHFKHRRRTVALIGIVKDGQQNEKCFLTEIEGEFS